MIKMRFILISVLVGAVILSFMDQTQAKPNGATVGNCPIFPADNAWNLDVSNAPIHPMSNSYVRSLARGPNKHLRAGFGLWPEYGMPYAVVSGSQPKVPIAFTEWGMQSDPGPYPIPHNAPIEGAGKVWADRHVIVVDKDNCMLYEMHNAEKDRRGPGWYASSGAVFNLRSNAKRPAGWTSADAAGLPIFPGLVRYDEVAAGAITHALRITVWRAQAKFVHPATHFQGNLKDKNFPPMGTRLRLKASFDTSKYSPHARVILEAMKRYGVMIADIGQNFYVSGTSDPRWDRRGLEQLRKVPITAFEAVVIPGMDEEDGGLPAPSPRPINTPVPPTRAPVVPTRASGSSVVVTRVPPTSVPVSRPDLRVLYMITDTNPFNNNIHPVLRIANNSNFAVDYSDIRLRYWFTRDKDIPLNVSCERMDAGCQYAWGFFTPLVETAPNADTYLEIAFQPGARSIPARGRSGQIQFKITRQDWSPFDERNDYSFDPTRTAFAETTRVTLYYKGALIWGAPPSLGRPAPTEAPQIPTRVAPTFVPADERPQTSSSTNAGSNTTVRRLKIQYRTGEDRPDDGQIGPNVQIANITREPIAMHNLTIRYWFTRDSNQRLFFYCDYADVGCENVWGRVVTMDGSRPGADSYLEIGFGDMAGDVPPLGKTGALHIRVRKADWGPFNEINDYSFGLGRTTSADWTKITLYENGRLVWGTEP
jgi:hypothetical protein